MLQGLAIVGDYAYVGDSVSNKVNKCDYNATSGLFSNCAQMGSTLSAKPGYFTYYNEYLYLAKSKLSGFGGWDWSDQDWGLY
jgi:hypothetical protein